MTSYNITELSTPEWLDTGNNAWQLTAATLVGLQSVPGLMVVYAGLMKKKWAINSAFMALYAFAATLIVWVLYAYRAAFGVYMLPFVGVPNQAVSIDYELSQSTLPSAAVSQNFPNATMIYFQFVFAAITVVITAGAWLGRMNFLAWMVYVPLWITFSYTVGAYSIWGGGFLFNFGVLDYSGGYVIHLSSGTAAIVGAWWIGPRLQRDIDDNRPSNIIMALVGTGIVWLGWNGFNGGDPYSASPDAGVAVLNTNLAAATSMLCWTACDMIWYKKPSVLGAINGIITGLVAITPAAGFVAGWGAILLAIGSGVVPWMTMNLVHKRIGFLRRIDDTLGIFHTHFVAAIVGGCGTGIFATSEGVPAFGTAAPGGAVAGYGVQVGKQIAGALFIIGWNVVWTSLILCFIKFVLRIPLRMSEEDLLIGDMAIHGEEAYAFGDGMHHSTLHGDVEAGIIEGRNVSEDEKDPDMIGGPVNLHNGGTSTVKRD